jgi:ABC-type Fe3+ transport system substrate-binding protein
MTLTSYKVTAANCAFYQTLVVQADSAETAATKFREYLASGSNQPVEEEEYEMGVQFAADTGEEPNDREDYAYDFEDDDVQEFDADEPTSAEVVMVSSGGNG